MYGGALDLRFAAGQGSGLQLVGSYLQFEDLDKLQPQIRRQNTRVAGLFVHEYQVVDLIARIRRGGQVPLELVANYCLEHGGGREQQRPVARGRAGQRRRLAGPARVHLRLGRQGRDLAAFNTDDFFWGTGWEGHRLDLATGTVKSSSIHGIAQRQRFKDSPDPVLRRAVGHALPAGVAYDVLAG